MIDLNRKIIFTHPQKCGGTTIEAGFGWHPNYVSPEKRLEHTTFFKKFKHASLTEHIKHIELLGHTKNQFFKFACVRNPWDITVSWYFFQKHFGKPIALGSFEDYVINKFKIGNFLDIKPFLYYNNEYCIDYIIRHENYTEDTQRVFNKFSIEWKENFNIHTRPENTPYQNIHTKKTKDLVYEKANQTIELFGYKF